MLQKKEGFVGSAIGVCNFFKEWFHKNRLCDLGFKGRAFTWSRETLHKRLDRVMCNEDWLCIAPEIIVFHLPQVQSDYHPLLARECNVVRSHIGQRSFHFPASWLRDNRFPRFVFDNWDVNKSYVEMGEEFVFKVNKWNKEIFGNIFKRQKRLLARIGGVQKALEFNQTNHLIKL